METTPQAIFGFVTLLVFPLLGLLAMLKKRASPLLWTTVILWFALGGLALWIAWYPGLTREEFKHDWLIGCALGAAFLAVDWLRTRRKIAKWLKVTIGVITIAVFAKALHDFLLRYG